jgi:hypothetical protein
MRRLLLSAAGALLSLASPANAEPRHTWVMVNYAAGTCAPVTFTPEEFYNGVNVRSSETGTHMDRIVPENVDKDASGAIHVRTTGTNLSGPVHWDFFTSKDFCDNFVRDQGITPEQAPADDIN